MIGLMIKTQALSNSMPDIRPQETWSRLEIVIIIITSNAVLNI